MPKKIEFNKDFEKAFSFMEKTSKNVFITGRAGTGKSTLLQYFIKETKREVVVLAPTGVAALNVNGVTIHSFFRLRPQMTDDDVEKKAYSLVGNELYETLDVIVIDEISMVRADLLDQIDIFLRIVRKNKKSFGGVQMIFFGDLYQLPPVVKGEEREFFRTYYDSPYFFASHVFSEKRFVMEFVELEKIYRQSDQKFIKLLNGIRNKSINDKELKELNKRVQEDFESMEYITLTTTNKTAEIINEKYLKELGTESYNFEADIRGDFGRSSYPTSMDLELKTGAKVMMLNNDPQGFYVNGTIAEITEVEEDGVWISIDDEPEVFIKPYKWKVQKYTYDKKKKMLDKETLGSFEQIPMKLAWAITIHKSQGKTFEKVILDLERGAFAHGQTYVALSRCVSFEGLVLRKPITKHHVIMDYQVVKFLTKYQYDIAEEKCSVDDKVEILKKAIKEKTELKIIYLKAQDVKSERTILVKKIGEMTYMEKSFLGIKAYCLTRKADRVFRVDRILEIL